MDASSHQTPPPAEPLPVRRTFFRWLTYGAGAAAAAVLAVPFVGFLFGVRKQPAPWVPLGPVSAFPPDETRLVTFDNLLHQPWDGLVAQTGVYVRNLGQGQFLVLAVNCAHLGCPVSWFPQSGLFLCPCHGGVYYENGERASGPPPRGLFHCVYRVTRAGKVEHLEIQAPHYPTLQDTLQKPA
jgi:Rieske Fe-S protein